MMFSTFCLVKHELKSIINSQFNNKEIFKNSLLFKLKNIFTFITAWTHYYKEKSELIFIKFMLEKEAI